MHFYTYQYRLYRKSRCLWYWYSSHHSAVKLICCESRLALHNQICLACVWELVKDITKSKQAQLWEVFRDKCVRGREGGEKVNKVKEVRER